MNAIEWPTNFTTPWPKDWTSYPCSWRWSNVNYQQRPPRGRRSMSARALARSNLADARDLIWNKRSQVLETGDLAKALGDMLRSLTEGVKTRISAARRADWRR